MIKEAMDPDFKAHWEQILRDYNISSKLSPQEQTEAFAKLILYVYQNLPEQLFRFRSCDIHNYSIDAFREDVIYSVKANKFNDPFDTLLKYDRTEFNKQVSDPYVLKKLRKQVLETDELPEEFRDNMDNSNYKALKSYLASLSEEQVNRITKNYDPTRPIELTNKQIDNELVRIQNTANISCFSERIDNILMWSHYADYHKGFALEYNFCTKEYEGLAHKVFPVVYSDKKLDVQNVISALVSRSFGANTVIQDTRYFVKAALFKSLDWAYEKEWRLISGFDPDIDVAKDKAKPTAIYYGCRIDRTNFDELHEIAKSKGIVEYKMEIDSASDNYNMIYTKI